MVGLRDLCIRCRRETGFQPRTLLASLESRGGWGTLQQVIGPESLDYGFQTICEVGRPDLTVEAWVLAAEACHHWFTEEQLVRARDRVAACESANRRRKASER